MTSITVTMRLHHDLRRYEFRDGAGVAFLLKFFGGNVMKLASAGILCDQYDAVGHGAVEAVVSGDTTVAGRVAEITGLYRRAILFANRQT